MNNVLNTIKFAFAAFAGSVIYFVGGFDTLLKCLLALMIVDFSTGFLLALVSKKVESKVFYKGGVKKIFIFAIIMVTVCVENTVGMQGLREIVIVYYIANECISILENGGNLGIPLPPKLVGVLNQLKDKQS